MICEDPALITGQGKYTGDIQLDDMLHMAVLRSPYAHAKIGDIDTSAAESIEGVVAVLTAEAINAQTAAPLPMIIESNPTYSIFEQIPRYALATDRVRHVGDQVDVIRLAANKEGILQAADLKIIADCGAYYSSVMPGIPPLTGMMMTSVYNVPNARCQADGILTNKNINEPYRGAGRPEAVYMMERAMNVLAEQMEMDPIELRRKNFIPSDAFPYTTPTGATYDSGEYAKPLDKLLEEIDYPALRAEQAQRRQNGGKLLGIGLACYVEICGFGPWEAGDYG